MIDHRASVIAGDVPMGIAANMRGQSDMLTAMGCSLAVLLLFAGLFSWSKSRVLSRAAMFKMAAGLSFGLATGILARELDDAAIVLGIFAAAPSMALLAMEIFHWSKKRSQADAPGGEAAERLRGPDGDA